MAYLCTHPDQEFVGFIYRGLNLGLSLGFRIGFGSQSSSLHSSSRHHPSSLQDGAIVSRHIAGEVEVGRMQGPILPAPVASSVHTSPNGLIHKAHQVGKWRLISELSFPRNASVNDGIRQDLCSIQYSSVDDAVSLIRILGQSTPLIKLDIKDAYRNIPVHPYDQPLLGISWNDNIYIDRALPFGLRSAPKLFSAFADSIAWVLYKRGVEHQLHYLDDFLFFGRPGSGEAQRALSIVLDTFDELGVPVATHKTEGPSTCLSFLGILIDTHRMELRLPHDKLCRLHGLVASWVGRKS